ncbi:hypothetical protein ROHU_013495 [Labeo rohita]|uniref:Uncharacterized protein n=1 Tax=Labeo rohita TaxID=84645 RepID=A0A498L9C2_LABRO|nr:hypothetical protein ROHU_013495 [Labeo rohita]
MTENVRSFYQNTSLMGVLVDFNNRKEARIGDIWEINSFKNEAQKCINTGKTESSHLLGSFMVMEEFIELASFTLWKWF